MPKILTQSPVSFTPCGAIPLLNALRAKIEVVGHKAREQQQNRRYDFHRIRHRGSLPDGLGLTGLLCKNHSSLLKRLIKRATRYCSLSLVRRGNKASTLGSTLYSLARQIWAGLSGSIEIWFWTQKSRALLKSKRCSSGVSSNLLYWLKSVSQKW